MSGFDKRLDEILSNIAGGGLNNEYAATGEEVEEAKQAIKALVLEEVIGEDEPESWAEMENADRNALREDQRQIVK
jgi:hypothetical protein